MSVILAGIDYTTASIDIRQKFSFTKSRLAEALQQIQTRPEISGCVLLSTCNRTELYLSTRPEASADPLQLLCQLKGLEAADYRDYFRIYQGDDAVRHLLRLASGLESQILGEDQIITQVGDALTTAREFYTADKTLEVLFRIVVTAAKKVKTQVVFHHGNTSAVQAAVDTLLALGIPLTGSRCLVIGNGEMGKLTATTLLEAGADVTVTVRQYRSGQLQIPPGCRRIQYSERLALLPSCDLVFSATSSPNTTLNREQLASLSLKEGLILVDLAVPRDIDPEIASLPGLTLYDVDSFRSHADEAQLLAILQAEEILQEAFLEFQSWNEGKDLIPRIRSLTEAGTEDLHLRLQKKLRKLCPDEMHRKEVTDAIDASAGKVMTKLLFGLKAGLEKEVFQECLNILEALYREDA